MNLLGQILFSLLLTLSLHGYTQPGNRANLGFIPNQGQFGKNGVVQHEVLFGSSNQSVFLRQNGVSYITKVTTKTCGTAANEEQLFPNPLFQDSVKTELQQIDLDFLGGHFTSISLSHQLPGTFNYYYPHCPNGVLGVPAYKEVVYQQVYKHIDLAFRLNKQGDLKYDFVLYPGANPRDIRMEWTGADSIKINSNGNLELHTPVGIMKESIPVIYQLINEDTIRIQGSYVIHKQRKNATVVGFEIGDYNPNFTLVIDPWVTNYGGEFDDMGYATRVDQEGNIYVSGETESNTGISEAGYQMTNGGGDSDAFLVKFNTIGEREWATYYGGTGAGIIIREIGDGLAVDSNGDIYVGGASSSPSVMGSPGAFQTTNGGGNADAFLVKFNTEGERLWGTYYGGVGEDYAYAVSVDTADNVYLGGYTFSETGMVEAGHQMTYGGFVDAFLVKFSAAGERIWGTYYGGENGDVFYDVTVDKYNNVVACGATTSPDLISTPGVFQTTAGGGPDCFVVRFNSDGNRLWGSYLGNSWVERGDGIVTDTLGNIYITGKTTAPVGTASPGAFQEENGGVSDGFLAKFDTEGNRLWSTYIGGEQIDYGFGIGLDPISNNVVVSGETFSEDFPVSPCAPQQDLIGTQNVFIAQFLPDGSRFCSSYFGSDEEASTGLAVEDCWVYFTGKTKGDVGTPGAHQEVNAGGADALLGRVHLASCGMSIPDWTEYETTQTDVTSCTPCNGSATVDIADLCLNPQALKTYIWSNGVEEWYTTAISSTIDGICEGEYWVAVTINCDQTDTFYFDIGNTASITADFIASVGSDICVGDTVSFTNLSSTVAGTIVSTEWNFGDGATSVEEHPMHVFNVPGEFSIELAVENESECADSMLMNLQVHPHHEVNIDTVICEGEFFLFPDGAWRTVTADTSSAYGLTSFIGCDSTVHLSIEVAPNSAFTQEVSLSSGDFYVFPDGSETFIFSDTSQVSTLVSVYNCDSLITTIIVVEDQPISDLVQCITPPNIFTPGNEDGKNDLFYFPSEEVAIFKCKIVNRWGQLVYQYESINDAWDGTAQTTGADCPNGVYYYVYEGEYNNGEPFNGYGFLHLVRE